MTRTARKGLISSHFCDLTSQKPPCLPVLRCSALPTKPVVLSYQAGRESTTHQPASQGLDHRANTKTSPSPQSCVFPPFLPKTIHQDTQTTIHFRTRIHPNINSLSIEAQSTLRIYTHRLRAPISSKLARIPFLFNSVIPSSRILINHVVHRRQQTD